MGTAVMLADADITQWRSAFARGERPAALPYGIDALGIDLVGAPPAAPSGLAAWLRPKVEHRLGVPVERALRAAPLVARADLVVALMEQHAAAPLWARRHRIPPYAATPVYVYSCWLADDARRAGPAEREALRRRFAGVDLLSHLSRHETQTLVDLGLPPERLHAMTYGVAADFYTPPPREAERDIAVLAVGQDRGRDYATLFAAVRGSDVPVDVVCRPENLTGLDVPGNVTVHAPVDHRTYRSLLRRAQVVAVPTHDLAYPTGSSVALEAAACGACVVGTSTLAMRDYLVHDSTALLAPVGDVASWRDLLRLALDDPDLRERLGAGARRSVETTFNADVMWSGIRGALDARGLLPSPA